MKNPRANHNFLGRTCSIAGVGSYVPEKILTNADLEKMVETSDEWITTRTGIKERRIAAANEFTSDLAAKAAERAMAMAGVTAEQIDLIIVASITPDMPFPNTACLVQQKIGARRVPAFDIEAACSGFIYALEVGQNFIMSRACETVLVIGAEKLSAITNWKDRNTCVLFGDGAGAVLIEPAEAEENAGFIDFLGEIDGSGGDALKMPAGGSRLPASHETVDQRLHYVHQDGAQVFKYAVRKMYETCRDVLARNGLTGEDVAVMIPHQANKRIITAAGERLGIAPEKVLINIERYGNTTAGTIPLATRDAISEGRLKKGDLALLAAVGAGYTVGASLWRWAY
jgi:3-oxoacyl-[acyl-carrier-protein] synthase-3